MPQPFMCAPAHENHEDKGLSARSPADRQWQSCRPYHVFKHIHTKSSPNPGIQPHPLAKAPSPSSLVEQCRELVYLLATA
mmetsp:Transcript_75618/g.208633  ORF Transcript_75618/g.208633 Transcript_75618/m.208633 type:complete len:80 (-) Transcript_75618:757-996(-)